MVLSVAFPDEVDNKKRVSLAHRVICTATYLGL
jgi:hypothetical protein